MSTLEQDIIDALVADINANAALPQHNTVSYRIPRAIMPEDCPLLVVWLNTKTPTPKTTEWFESLLSFGVSYHVETVEEAQTLIDNPDIAVALLDARSKIEARIRYLAANGLAGGAWEVVPGVSEYIPAEQQAGLVEGFANEVLARVTEGS